MYVYEANNMDINDDVAIDRSQRQEIVIWDIR